MRNTVHIDGNPMDPVVLFKGTDEEIAKFDAIEDRLASEWADIVMDPSFKGLKFEGSYPGSVLYLTPSIRIDDGLQLSYMDKLGPVMHETFSRTEECTREYDPYLARKVETTHPFSQLLQRLSHFTPDEGIDIVVEREDRAIIQDRLQSIKNRHKEAVGKGSSNRDVSRGRG